MRTVNLVSGDEFSFVATGASAVTYEIEQTGAASPVVRDAVEHRDQVIRQLKGRIRQLEIELYGEDEERDMP